MADRIAITTAMAAVVGRDHVLIDDDQIAGAIVDWTGRFHGSCACVVRPADVAQVAAVLRWSSDNGVAVVTQGGNTGLVGGATPVDNAIVLSTVRLRSIESIDAVSGQITVGGGVTLVQLQEALVGTGWEFAVDLGARGSATIGGMAATNAGGMRVLAHGMMRRQVVGLEAVLADGSIVGSMSGLVKDNTGYDLAGLLCGSEGTLAVITGVRLALVRAAAERVTALVAADGLDDAVLFAADVLRQVAGVDALEFVTAEGVALAGEMLGLRCPISAAVVVLVELAGSDADALADALAVVVGERSCAVATDTAGRAALWAVRERQAEAINRLGPPHKLDVTLPLTALALFCDVVGAVVAAAIDDAESVKVHLFGHLGDGNVHVNVSGVDPDDELVDEAVLRLVVAHGGSISAEHGIGRAKRKWLHLQRSDAEITAMRAVKRALDPTGIMNPGVLL